MQGLLLWHFSDTSHLFSTSASLCLFQSTEWEEELEEEEEWRRPDGQSWTVPCQFAAGATISVGVSWVPLPEWFHATLDQHPCSPPRWRDIPQSSSELHLDWQQLPVLSCSGHVFTPFTGEESVAQNGAELHLEWLQPAESCNSGLPHPSSRRGLTEERSQWSLQLKKQAFWTSHPAMGQTSAKPLAFASLRKGLVSLPNSQSAVLGH